jgi:hypothetical protein
MQALLDRIEDRRSSVSDVRDGHCVPRVRVELLGVLPSHLAQVHLATQCCLDPSVGRVVVLVRHVVVVFNAFVVQAWCRRTFLQVRVRARSAAGRFAALRSAV